MCFRQRKIFILLSIAASVTLGSSFAHGGASFSSRCESFGKELGSQLSKNESEKRSCFLQVIEQARSNRKLYTSSSGGKIKVFGYKNLIYIQKDTKVALISGTMSNLNNVESVALSQDEKTIAVLDGYKDESGYWRKQILFFESSLDGNVIPFSINSEKIVSYASSISFSNNDQVVMNLRYPAYAGKAERYDIVSFNKKGDSRSAAQKNKPENKVLLSSSNSLSIKNPVSVVAKDNQLIILGESEVQFFNLEKDSYKLTNSIRTAERPQSLAKTANHFTMNPAKKVLQLFDNSGNSVEIPY